MERGCPGSTIYNHCSYRPDSTSSKTELPTWVLVLVHDFAANGQEQVGTGNDWGKRECELGRLARFGSFEVETLVQPQQSITNSQPTG